MSVGERANKTTRTAASPAPAPREAAPPQAPRRSSRGPAAPPAKPPALGRRTDTLFQGEGHDGLRYERLRPGARVRLPRPLHSADCLYYIVSGEIRGAGRTRRTGDGFLVGAGSSPAWTAGREGAELLELRTATRFDADETDRLLDGWTRIGGALAARRRLWQPRRRSDRPRPEGGTRPGDPGEDSK
ncbi:hypothetical protein LO772_02160 [Yinghuangia sp. ASG 101]|uniref:hypothetical protein n=1 Tax=Yinghuangia sp. ASG 101 TaxID=2896848 RepID=UPI001E5BF446|nr:hypothetical protein [Yinghuangia sp. ASG 101]UGQ12440.1 hypothetical protein LO772_02160 [Yinghuangia sp. ASG 101]